MDSETAHLTEIDAGHRTPRTHRDLVLWHEGIALADAVYETTRAFPHEELYGLTSQMRRATVSVPTNVAEVAARGTQKEFRHFLFVARGSLSELETLIIIANNAGILTDESSQTLSGKTSHVSSILQGLLNKMR